MFSLKNYSGFQNSNNYCELVPGGDFQWICFKLHKDTNILNIKIYRNEKERELMDVLSMKLKGRPQYPSSISKYEEISAKDVILKAGVYCFSTQTLNGWFNERSQKPSFKLVIKDSPQDLEYFLNKVSCGKKKKRDDNQQSSSLNDSNQISLNTQQQSFTYQQQLLLNNQNHSVDELLREDLQGIESYENQTNNPIVQQENQENDDVIEKKRDRSDISSTTTFRGKNNIKQTKGNTNSSISSIDSESDNQILFDDARTPTTLDLLCNNMSLEKSLEVFDSHTPSKLLEENHLNSDMMEDELYQELLIKDLRTGLKQFISDIETNNETRKMLLLFSLITSITNTDMNYKLLRMAKDVFNWKEVPANTLALLNEIDFLMREASFRLGSIILIAAVYSCVNASYDWSRMGDKQLSKEMILLYKGQEKLIKRFETNTTLINCKNVFPFKTLFKVIHAMVNITEKSLKEIDFEFHPFIYKVTRLLSEINKKPFYCFKGYAELKQEEEESPLIDSNVALFSYYQELFYKSNKFVEGMEWQGKTNDYYLAHLNEAKREIEQMTKNTSLISPVSFLLQIEEYKGMVVKLNSFMDSLPDIIKDFKRRVDLEKEMFEKFRNINFK
ncbi:hypothetical protein ABK040_004144 [Willaertia magna]